MVFQKGEKKVVMVNFLFHCSKEKKISLKFKIFLKL